MEAKARAAGDLFDYQKRLLGPTALAPLRTRMEDDLRLLTAIRRDCRQGWNLVAMNRKIDEGTALDLLELYRTALSVIEQEFDMVSVWFSIGVFIDFVLGPLKELEKRAKRMLVKVSLLKEELKRAEREVTKREAKIAIHTYLTVVEELNPHLRLMVSVQFFLMDEMLEYALGPEYASPIDELRTEAIPVAKLLDQGIEKVKAFGSAAHQAAKQSGRSATAATIYYDMQDIMEATERVHQIKERIEDLKEAHSDLIDFLNRNSPLLTKFEHQLARIEQNTAEPAEKLAHTRATLNDEIQAFRYNPDRPLAWPVRP